MSIKRQIDVASRKMFSVSYFFSYQNASTSLQPIEKPSQFLKRVVRAYVKKQQQIYQTCPTKIWFDLNGCVVKMCQHS